MIHRLAFLLTLGLGLLLGGACQPQPECPPCEQAKLRSALVYLFDGDGDQCVTEEGRDHVVFDQLYKVRGASVANAFRAIAGQCLPLAPTGGQ